MRVIVKCLNILTSAPSFFHKQQFNIYHVYLFAHLNICGVVVQMIYLFQFFYRIFPRFSYFCKMNSPQSHNSLSVSLSKPFDLVLKIVALRTDQKYHRYMLRQQFSFLFSEFISIDLYSVRYTSVCSCIIFPRLFAEIISTSYV